MSEYVPRGLHLVDPAELQLHIDPTLGEGLGPAPAPNLIPSYMDLLNSGVLGPPDAQHRLWEHYTDPPPAGGSGFDLGRIMPRLPGGADITGDGIGGTLGDFDFRFRPYIPGILEPDDPPDPHNHDR